MAILPVIIDSQPDFLRSRSAPRSLLLMPLGFGSVLSHLAERIAGVDADDICILPPPTLGAEYQRMIESLSGSTAKVLRPDELADKLHECEPSDTLLLVDPRYWPAEGFDFSSIVKRNGGGGPWALHAVAVQASQDGAQEYVRTDERGFVRRVRRYYDRVTWPETGGIPYSLIPITAAEDVSFHSLADLRSTLSDQGMLSQDVPLCTGIADVGIERTFLALSERAVVDAASGSVPPGYTLSGRQILVGTDCQIDPSARIVGPAVIQHGATIGANATIIGPALIGASSTVSEGARVLHSVVALESTVESDVTVRMELVTGWHGPAMRTQTTVEAGPLPPTPFGSPETNEIGTPGESAEPGSTTKSWYQRTKLLIDMSFAAVWLIILSPLIAFVAILIKLDSDGPVLFGHEREGLDGKLFKCWKFRTMTADAHQRQREMYNANSNQVDGPQFKIDCDPRITRVGGWLRATNIDEIPQLFNVFAGQMSFVGPRPSPFRENQICIPWRRARLSVRPGITGLWQVCRHDRSSGDFHQWIAYDTKYVANASLIVDFKIVLATILTLGGQRSIPESWIIPEQEPMAATRTRRRESGDGVSTSS